MGPGTGSLFDTPLPGTVTAVPETAPGSRHTAAHPLQCVQLVGQYPLQKGGIPEGLLHGGIHLEQLTDGGGYLRTLLQLLALRI